MQPFARREVSAVAVLTGLLLLALSGRYGYHRDELYFLEAGRHLAWGYPDQPPLTPLLARAMSAIAPDSLVVLRLPSTLSAAAIVFLAGLIAGELGARRDGQILAAGATAMSAVVLATGHLLSTSTSDLLGWALLTLLFVRLLLGRSGPRAWLAVGLVSGVTLEANVLVGFLLVAGLIAVLIVGPREVLRSWWMPSGALIATAMIAPYLIWQAQHGWPQLEIAHGIANGGSGSSQPRWAFLPYQLLLVGPWLTPIWVTGLVRLWREERLRSLSLVYGLLCGFFLITGGKPYYVAGLYPLLIAAGSQSFLDKWRKPWIALALNIPALVIVLPVLPAAAAGPVVAMNYDAGETIGWPQYVGQIAAAYDRQPPGTALLAANYGEAGAIDRYGNRFGLPAAYSGHNGFGVWGPPPAGTTTVLAVGLSREFLEHEFTSVVRAGTLHNSEGIDNDEQGAPLFACAGPRASWARLWPDFTSLG